MCSLSYTYIYYAPARCAALLESLEAACRTVRTLGVFETAPAGEVPM